MINTQNKQSVNMHNHSSALSLTAFSRVVGVDVCVCVCGGGGGGEGEGVRRNETYIYRFPPVVHTITNCSYS